MKFLVSIYGHPEFYPPTLNAVKELSGKASEIYLLGRNVRATEWPYPENVHIRLTGKYMPVPEAQNAGMLKKIIFFLQFTFAFYRHIVRHRPHWVLCYDAIPLLSYRIVCWFVRRPPKIWYHNHDVMKMQDMKKYSVGWWAVRSEKTFFHRVDIFSIPSMERVKYFPMQNFKGKFFHLPNFPSVDFYKKFETSRPLNGKLHLIYQGTIGRNHGIEELMHYISQTDKNIEFSLIGNANVEFKERILMLRDQLGLQQSVHVYDPVSYAELPKITATAHAGIAVNMPDDIMYATAGTASNKIYEYAAVGLPIFYYDTEHYRAHLGQYKWAIPTKLTKEGLDQQIQYLQQDYSNLSSAALNDFKQSLNFENNFRPVLNYLYA